MSEPIVDVAAGVPFTALPPEHAAEGPAPLVVTWHMLDAPRTDAAFAGALPLAGVPAWRVHLGMPLTGRRTPEGGLPAILERVRPDMMASYVDLFVRQAVEEFPAVLAELRERFSVDGGPVGIVGGSLGGAVALRVLADARVPVSAAALVNPAVRVASVAPLMEELLGEPYRWTDAGRAAAEWLDFVAAADGIATRQPPLLLLSGEQDHPRLRTDAGELVTALRERYARPEHVQLVSVPGLAHPLAEEPGAAPGGELPAAAVVDEAVTGWLLRHTSR